MEYSLSDEYESGDSSEMDSSYQERSVNGLPICRACSKEIFDKYYLRVNEMSWHEECLKCSYCSLVLSPEETCFIKKSQILCKIDYYKNFGIKCAKCTRNIQSSDWVRRAKENVYHLACFACESCKRQLSTGEEFALQNNKVLCKTHYCESIDGENSENSKSKNKRVRTTFSEEQLQVLQANFEVDSNPDGQDLERIAQITGLSKRVTQVWFQNSRARQKKYKEKKIDVNSTLDLNESLTNEDEENEEDELWPPAPPHHRSGDLGQAGMVLSSIQTPLSNGQMLMPVASSSSTAPASSGGSGKAKRQSSNHASKSTKSKKFNDGGAAKKTKYSKKLESELSGGLSAWTSDEDNEEAYAEGGEDGEHSIWTEDGLHRFDL